jgi:hypothetical protein
MSGGTSPGSLTMTLRLGLSQCVASAAIPSAALLLTSMAIPRRDTSAFNSYRRSGVLYAGRVVVSTPAKGSFTMAERQRSHILCYQSCPGIDAA